MLTERDGSLTRARRVTEDPDQAHEWLQSKFSEHAVDLVGPTNGFRLAHSLVDAGGFSVSRLEHHYSAQATSGPIAYVAVNEVINGTHRVTLGHRDIGAGPGEALLHPSGVATGSRWEDLTVRVVCLPAAAIAAELGCEPGDLRFDGLRPVSVTLGRDWSSLTRHVSRMVAPGGPVEASDLVRDTTARLLIATLVTAFPISAPSRVPSVWGAEAVVRRAVRWIDDNAHRPIGVPEIAAAVRVSTGWLSEAFRQRCSLTPMQYVRRVRLEGAHRELKAADPSAETVAEVAVRWGFAHPGRFAAAYRARYRCPPSVTLRS